jgi:SAM-dependent methyltransferase
MDVLNSEYWSNRYNENQIGWDLGEISPPIKAYIDQLEDKKLRILIPGCGLGHEAEYLFNKGFQNTCVLDFASEPILNFQNRNPKFPKEQLFIQDFFEHVGQYDLIIEQTLFCAIDPKLRANYAKKMVELLKPKGKLVGLLFNKQFQDGPPFGGNKEEYLTYFSKYFNSIYMENAYNSIKPRQDSELFIIIQNTKSSLNS